MGTDIEVEDCPPFRSSLARFNVQVHGPRVMTMTVGPFIVSSIDRVEDSLADRWLSNRYYLC